ncbi:MAG: hypothetical protein WB554_07400, partial [Desulfomonilaceae bacterium]
MKHALLYGFVLLSIFLALFVGGVNADNVAASKEIINATMTNATANASQIASQMKTIGILGGVSWVSSLEYYRLMNQMVNKQLGGSYSAKILMYSIEFGEFSKDERLAEKGDWNALNKTIIDAAQRLKRGGADFI